MSKIRRRTIEFVGEVDDQRSITKRWVGKINSDTWRNDAPKTWLIVRVDCECVTAYTRPPVYRIVWWFEYRDKGWDPFTIAYKDQATGERPNGLVGATVIKDIDRYDAVEFTGKFDHE